MPYTRRSSDREAFMTSFFKWSAGVSAALVAALVLWLYCEAVSNNKTRQDAYTKLQASEELGKIHVELGKIPGIDRRVEKLEQTGEEIKKSQQELHLLIRDVKNTVDRLDKRM